MTPSSPLIEARLVRRYKRFLADVRLKDGTLTTVHCPNTGAMQGCDTPGSIIWLSSSENVRRKYPLGWELIEVSGGALVGINSRLANELVFEALVDGGIEEIGQPTGIRREASFADHRARIDFLLSLGEEKDNCLLEVKSVTAVDSNGIAYFPDAVSLRAVRHLDFLVAKAATGIRCVLFYCVQRNDIDTVRAATEVHADYGRALIAAERAGVEILAYRCNVGSDEISLASRVDVELDVV
ncbi:MAG: DNA/RNA nuclease SfsA [Gammaproteobacteria bacterium]